MAPVQSAPMRQAMSCRILEQHFDVVFGRYGIANLQRDITHACLIRERSTAA